MNIFVLDNDPAEAAKMHCDAHVVKMVLETTQILCGVHHRHGTPFDGIYKPSHPGNPTIVWASAALGNYRWLCRLLEALHAEYVFRYGKAESGMSLALHAFSGGKTHKSMALLDRLVQHPPLPLVITNYEMVSLPPFIGPESIERRHEGDIVECYRQLYLLKRATMKRPMRWTRREAPKWFTEAP